MLHGRLVIYSSIVSTFLFLILFTSSVPTTYGADTVVASLVNTIDTSVWSPPSPDPAGITYNSVTNTLFVSDSEVDEMTIFQDKNVYETTLDGTLVSTGNTMAFTSEPTDIAFNLTNGHYFISSDLKKRVYELDLGLDGQFGTGDDSTTFISTMDFGDNDTEGVGYGDGKLFVTDGTGHRIYVVSPGLNGLFDGVTPTGDDEVTSFDVGIYGTSDPEGVTYNADNNTLFVVDYKRTNKIVLEVTIDGQLVRKIDISQAGALHPAGVVYAPASTNPSIKHLYIADRGLDNNSHPTENDGKIYEMSIPTTTPTPTPTLDPALPTATPTPTDAITPTDIPTPTPTSTQQTILTFSPSDDATVSINTPNKNLGQEVTVGINQEPQKNFLMKFIVSGINGKQVTQARLRLYSTNGSNLGGDFHHLPDNNWSEATVTWNTAPLASSDVLAFLGQVRTNNWYEVDLLPLITADGTYSIRVTSTSTDSAGYSSSEDTTFGPQLKVTTSQ